MKDKLRPMKVAVVDWTDAIVGDDWLKPEDIGKLTAEPSRSVGFLARSDAHVVVLVQTENTKHLGDHIVIPRQMVKKVRILK